MLAKPMQVASVSTVISFGSNMGSRSRNIQNALLQLSHFGKILCTSFLYESSPMYYLDQNQFLNGVCAFETDLAPLDLLFQLKSIERRLGREKTIENGPRPIDLDIIFYGDKIVELDSLKIPHPRMNERAFVLKPLCDINPDLLHPQLKETANNLYLSLSIEQKSQLTRVLSFHRANEERILRVDNEIPIIFGILNVTPDRFC